MENQVFFVDLGMIHIQISSRANLQGAVAVQFTPTMDESFITFPALLATIKGDSFERIILPSKQNRALCSCPKYVYI